MNEIKDYLYKIVRTITEWYCHSNWQEKAVVGGGSFLIFLFVFWVASLITREEFVGDDNVDDAYSSYIMAYTAGVLSTEASIQIKFFRSVADSSMLGEEVDEDYILFNPEVNGEAYWIDLQTLKFIPKEPLLAGQTYQVKVHLEEILSVPDELAYFEYAFKTMQQNFEIAIEGLTYPDREDLANPVVTGKLLTADYVEASQIEQMLSATQDGNTLDIEWQHEEGQLSHPFVVKNIIRQSGGSNIDLVSQGDPIGLSDSRSYHLAIPALSQFALINTRVVEEPEQYIELRFSDPLQENQELEGLVQIGQSSNQLRYVVDNNTLKVYTSENTYGSRRVVINEGIKSSRGQSLSQKTELLLSFEPIKPGIRFVNDGVIVPSADGMLLPFEAVNLSSVDVTVVKIFEDNLTQFFQVNQYDGNQQVRRVAQPSAQQRVPLNASGATELNRWNRFTLDLSEIVETDPGSVYQVILGFRQEQSLYHCNSPADMELSDMTTYRLAEEYSNPTDIYWSTYNQYYYADNYNWEERDNPCTPSYYGSRRSAQTNLLASNMGLIAKKGNDNNLYVAATDLLTSEPISGVDVDVYDFQQRLIAQESTDGDGELRVETKESPYLLVASDGNEKTYLRVDDGSSLSLSNFDVSGQEVRRGIKGFIYGERGVWRPGDSLHISFILEDQAEKLPESHPVIFELINPKGSVFERKVSTQSTSGIYYFGTATPEDAVTGNWMAKIKVGGASFNKKLRVESIRPNRLSVDLDFRTDQLTVRNSRPTAYLDVEWLSGATARNLKSQFEVTLTSVATNFDNYPSYTFDDAARQFAPQQKEVFNNRLNANGRANFAVDLGLEQDVPGKLNATFTGKVFEEGGNFSIHQKSIPYYPYSSFVGIDLPKGEGMGGMLLTGRSYVANLVVVDERGKKLGRRKLDISLHKLDWRWWWEQSEEYIANYISQEYREPVAQEVVETTSGEAEWEFGVSEEDWGRYYLRACDPASGHCTGEVVYLDWPGYAGRDQQGQAKAEAMLSFSADKQSYGIDEEATIYIPAKGEGYALVSIEDGSEIIETHWVELEDEDKTEFSFEIIEEMAPNIYVHVSLLQPYANTTNDLPIRMYGVIPIEVTDENTVLQPIIGIADNLEPESEVSITVSEANEREMAYTLAMVDDGLLDITNFSTPVPHKHFFAKEALGVKTWDMYDYVNGAFGGEMQRILAIGGDEAATLGSSRSVNRFTPVVKFLGPFYLEDGEENTHTIQLPNYVGSVRTMVVAAYEGAYGHKEVTTKVSKPLMVLGTLPRVLSPQETLKLPVNVFAMDNSVKSVRVSVGTGSLIDLVGERSAEMFFPNPGDKTVDFQLGVSPQTGAGRVEINAAAGPIRTDYNFDIDIQNPNPTVTESISELIVQGGTWETSFEAIGMNSTQEAILELSDIPPLSLGKRLAYLRSSPHSSIGHTVSSAFAQLYLPSIEELSEGKQRDVEIAIKTAIQQLSTFHTDEGGFAYWPGSNDASGWYTNYAGHFLCEAMQKGYQVPTGIFQSWLNYQTRRATQWGKSGMYIREDLTQAYRLYTLALAGQAAQGAMNRMREMSNLSLTATWRLANAYALLGQSEVAENLIEGLSSQIDDYSESKGTYGSSLRDQAMILETLSALRKREQGLNLYRRISSVLGSESWLSAQTTAFAIMASTKFATDMQLGEGVDASIQIDGVSVEVSSEFSVTQNEIDLSRGGEHTVSVSNNGSADLYARVILRGQPMVGEEEILNSGLNTEVAYKGIDGEPLSIDELTQGTDFVAEVTVYNPGDQGDLQHLSLMHRVPSGWEILNTKLSNLSAFQAQAGFEYQSVNDNLVYTYFGLNAGERKTFRIMLNASYVGRFYLPAIYTESMYDNTIRAGVPGKWIEVMDTE